MGAMMKKSFLVVFAVAAALAASLPTGAKAQQLIVNGSGQLTGANGVNVNGTYYDVTFEEGTCIGLFGGCTSSSNFDFQTSSSAVAAAAALLNQVFVDGPSGNFGSDPWLTYGCNDLRYCDVLIPYGFTNGWGDNAAVENWAPGGVDTYGSCPECFGTSFDSNMGNDDTIVWAKFAPGAPVPVAGVPEPSTWALMLLGFGAIGAAIRSRHRGQLQSRAA
jgi:hypothetical protein